MMNIKEMLQAVKNNSKKNIENKEAENMEKKNIEDEVMEEATKKIMLGAQMPLVIDGVEDVHTVVLSGKYRDIKNANGDVVATEPHGKIYIDRVYYGDFFGRDLVCFAWKRKGMAESIVKVETIDGQLVPMNSWWPLAILFYGSAEAAEDAVYNEQIRRAEDQERRGYFCEPVGENADGNVIYLVGRGKETSYPFAQIQSADGTVLGHAIWKFGNAPIVVWDIDGEKVEVRFNPYKDKEYPEAYEAIAGKLCDIFGRELPVPTHKGMKPMMMVFKPTSKVKAPDVSVKTVDFEKK